MAQTLARNHAPREHHQQYANMALLNPQRHVAPPTVLTKSKLVPITAVRPVNAVVPKPHVTRPRQAKTVVTKPNSLPQRHINPSPSLKASNFPPKVTAVMAPIVNGNLQHALKDKGVIDSRCSRHMTGNMSYLSDFEELNGRYVAFGGNPKGGIENQLSLKLKIIRNDNGTEFKNNDLNQFCGMKGIKREFSVPRTPQQNGIAERKNRTLIEAARTMLADSLLPIPFWVEAVNTACIGPTWLFDSDTLIKTMNYQPVTEGNQSNPSAGVQEQFDAEKAGEENIQQYVLFPVWSSGSTNPQNTDGNATFEVNEPEFERRKTQSEVYVSPSNKFEDFSDNSINEVNAADSPVPVVG
nr:putative ribonuclease H-like domain-containing protein [Tanacetum cinerariifolium]